MGELQLVFEGEELPVPVTASSEGTRKAEEMTAAGEAEARPNPATGGPAGLEFFLAILCGVLAVSLLAALYLHLGQNQRRRRKK